MASKAGKMPPSRGKFRPVRLRAHEGRQTSRLSWQTGFQPVLRQPGRLFALTREDARLPVLDPARPAVTLARMKPLLCFLLVLAGAGMGAGVMKFADRSKRPAVVPTVPVSPLLPAAFQLHLDAFLASAGKLAAITKARLRHGQFDEQYLATYAEFAALSSHWPDGYAAEARQEFQAALRGWNLTRQLWDQLLAGVTSLRHDSEFLATLEAYAPGRIFRFPDDKVWIPAEQNLGRLMAVGAEHFANGQHLLGAL